MSSQSASEGEIVEMEVDKATTAQQPVGGSMIDRQSRHRSPVSRSSRDSVDSFRSERYRSRSPYRRRSPPRGEKRRRDYDYGDRDRHDGRRPRVHYDDRPGRNDSYRSRVSYADLDRGDASSHGYDERGERDRYRGKQHRARSRSPGRRGRRGGQYDRYDRYDGGRRRDGYDQRGRDFYRAGENGQQRSREQSMNRWGVPSGDTRRRYQDAETRKGGVQDSKMSRSNRKHEVAPEITDGVGNSTKNGEVLDEPVAEPTPVDEAAIIEERRRRREAIRQAMKAKYLDLELGNDSSAATPASNTPGSRTGRSASPMVTSPATPRRDSAPESPAEFTVKNDEELANHAQGLHAPDEQDGPSAADYDPRMDMEEDKERDVMRYAGDDVSAADYDDSKLEHRDILLPDAPVDEGPAPKPAKKELDMFADEDDDEDDDMFAPEPANKAKDRRPARVVAVPQAKDKTLMDNWDDHEGYYIITPGEMIGKRYQIKTNLGKGMFSSVVRATDEMSNKLVAIKIIRNNETMRKAGAKEIEILQILAKADPDDKKHLVRLERSFEHGGHLCMVFENLSINLREVLKKFGRDVGINLKAVRSYAQQIFLGLTLLRKCNILHADLKPDNILVNEARNSLKICDLGSAADASDSEITPYLVSRFYRAPEIILGMHFDFAIDMWSIGCTLFELYTGKILFTGRTNNQMLRSIMECRGKFSQKMLKKAEFAGLHFEDSLVFRSVEKDRVTNRDVVRMLNFTKPTRDLKSRLLASSKGLTDVETKDVNLFADLLDRCLNLNPEKRCTPIEALKHPFISRPKP